MPLSAKLAFRLLLLLSVVDAIIDATRTTKQDLSETFRRKRIKDFESVRKLQDAPDDGRMRFHEATFLASHNAHANRDAANTFLETFGINQETSMFDQMSVNGVRALLVDIQINEDEFETLRLVHGPLDYGGFASEFYMNVVPFLQSDENAIITLIIETLGDDSGLLLQGLQHIFSALAVNEATLKEMTFKYDDALWAGHSDWPTLDEIRQSGQRIFVFLDRSEMADAEYGFMYKPEVMQENDWRGIDDCEPRYGWRQYKVSLPSNSEWSRLFLMNHFCCDLGSESYPRTIGNDLIGGGDNGWGVLYPRIEQCLGSNGGLKPNFIALDWVFQSEEAREVRDFLNFGGALGTGQACNEDSDCATSSCNSSAGLCQCRRCPPTSEDICDGCEYGQFCFSSSNDQMNFCQDKNQIEDTFFCGTEFFDTVANCNDYRKCPNGNDDCLPGEVCFAHVHCTPVPTPSPTDFPSMVPSIPGSHPPTKYPTPRPTTKKPTPRPTSKNPTPLPTMRPTPNLPNPSDSSIMSDTNFCGNDYFTTRENCQTATPCPEPFGNDICYPLGLTCFANIPCEKLPTTPPPALRPSIPPQATPTAPELPPAPPPLSPRPSPPPSPRPSPPPTEVDLVAISPRPSSAPTYSPTGGRTNTPTRRTSMYCGESYEDAKLTCSPRTACPRGFECPVGTVCFTGVICFTKKPTESPTFSPSSSFPTISPVITTAAPVTDAPITPTASPSFRPTRAPFDFDNENFCGSNFTDARSNCYYTTPCPTGSPSECPDGTCYSGIKCTAPPSASPTLRPTATPPVPPSMSPTTSSPNSSAKTETTRAPYDFELPIENNSQNTMSMINALRCFSAAIGMILLIT